MKKPPKKVCFIISLDLDAKEQSKKKTYNNDKFSRKRKPDKQVREVMKNKVNRNREAQLVHSSNIHS